MLDWPDHLPAMTLLGDFLPSDRQSCKVKAVHRCNLCLIQPVDMKIDDMSPLLLGEASEVLDTGVATLHL